MAPSPDLSIIIVSFNTQALTLACLRSLPISPQVEVVVVDNASTDGSVSAIAADFPNVTVLPQAANLGFARANNIGLAAAHGRHLLLLNSDTEMHMGAAHALISFLDTHPRAGACGPQLRNTDGSLQPSGRALPNVRSVALDMTRLYRLTRTALFAEAGRDYAQVSEVGELSGAALCVRRDVYAQIGGLDPGFFMYYEDTDWCKRIHDAGWTVHYVPTAVVTHHWGGSTRKTAWLPIAAGQDSLRRYFQKHHGPAAHRAIQLLLVAKHTTLTLLAALRFRSTETRLQLALIWRALKPLAQVGSTP
jgi:N-acetylglucosaminyl-diphospho-decaprenol L-rhamnosyltransferase